MEQVGYDMYCKLLDEVVKEMQGVKVEEEQDIQIEMNVSSYIPDTYIENSAQKIEIYQNIALCRDEEGIANVIDEIIDRYGPMPKEVENLIEIARIKNQARQTGVIKILQKQENIVFYYEPTKFEVGMVDVLIQKYKNRIKFSPAHEPYITYKIFKQDKIIEEVKALLETK